MSHAEETWQRWNEIGWMETVCERWEAFFGSLVDEPARAEALCALGLKVIRQEAFAYPYSGSSQWFTFFGSLIGKPEEAEALCALGLKVVRCEAVPGDEAIRTSVRSVLQSLNQ